MRARLALSALCLAPLLAGCGTVEKRADDTLPQALPANWQGGLPGFQNQGSGFR